MVGFVGEIVGVGCYVALGFGWFCVVYYFEFALFVVLGWIFWFVVLTCLALFGFDVGFVLIVLVMVLFVVFVYLAGLVVFMFVFCLV